MKSILAILAGGFFSFSFFADDPYWFVAVVMAVLCISLIRGGLLG